MPLFLMQQRRDLNPDIQSTGVGSQRHRLRRKSRYTRNFDFDLRMIVLDHQLEVLK